MRSTNHAFVNQLLIYTLCTICVSGSIGLGTVWMRHQISLTANASSKLESRLAEIDRHLAETSAAIGAQQDPALLKRLNTEWRLGLVVPPAENVISVQDESGLYLASKRNRGLFGDVPLTAPFTAVGAPSRAVSRGTTAIAPVNRFPAYLASKN